MQGNGFWLVSLQNISSPLSLLPELYGRMCFTLGVVVGGGWVYLVCYCVLVTSQSKRERNTGVNLVI